MMTIGDYIRIHTDDSFINNQAYGIVIAPFSICGKNHYEKQEKLSAIYRKQKEIGTRLRDKVTFFDMKKFAEKVDFSIEPKKIQVHYDSLYSYDACPETVFYVDDAEFIKIARSCEDM